jgi:ribonuclease HI
MRLTIFSDGACKGNPGHASIGIVILDDNKHTILEISKAIGFSTNNKAEYKAVIEGLSAAVKLKADEVELFMDSELVVRQLTGKYKVKNNELYMLYNKVIYLLQNFSHNSINHISRTLNERADYLANQALTQK